MTAEHHHDKKRAEQEARWLAQVLGPVIGKPYELRLFLGPAPVPHGAWDLTGLPTDGSKDDTVGLQVRRTILMGELEARAVMLPDAEFEALMERASEIPGAPMPLDMLRQLRAHQRPRMQAEAGQLAGLAEALMGPEAGAAAEGKLTDDDIAKILAELEDHGQ